MTLLLVVIAAGVGAWWLFGDVIGRTPPALIALGVFGLALWLWVWGIEESVTLALGKFLPPKPGANPPDD